VLCFDEWQMRCFGETVGEEVGLGQVTPGKDSGGGEMFEVRGLGLNSWRVGRWWMNRRECRGTSNHGRYRGVD